MAPPFSMWILTQYYLPSWPLACLPYDLAPFPRCPALMHHRVLGKGLEMHFWACLPLAPGYVQPLAGAGSRLEDRSKEKPGICSPQASSASGTISAPGDAPPPCSLDSTGRCFPLWHALLGSGTPTLPPWPLL